MTILANLFCSIQTKNESIKCIQFFLMWRGGGIGHFLKCPLISISLIVMTACILRYLIFLQYSESYTITKLFLKSLVYKTLLEKHTDFLLLYYIEYEDKLSF